LTVFARRKEIAIMKFVGATNWFIRWPFLLEGLMLGFIGGVIADVVLAQFYEFATVAVHSSLAFLPMVSMYPFMYHVGAILLVASMIIGAVGSTISLKRYMKV
jgi:cell division transport system permease protein